MPAEPSLLDRLLDEMARGVVVPEPYSTKSLYGRVEQLVLTAILAVLAIAAGMLLGGAAAGNDDRTRSSRGAGVDVAAVATAISSSIRPAKHPVPRHT